MIPHVSVEVPNDRRAMVADVAKNLFPGKKSIGELKPGQRERWIALACNLLYGDPEVSQEIAAATAIVAEAEIGIQEEQAAAEEHERTERKARAEETHEVDLDHKKQVAEIEGQRWQLEEQAVTQRLRQEEARESNGCWIERVLMVMIVVSFAVAIGLIVAAAKTGNSNPDSPSFIGWSLIAGGSGATGLLSLIMLGLHRTRRSRKELELLPQLAPPPPAPGGE
jgi:hypothetical protein